MSSEFGPLQFGGVVRITHALTDEEEGIAMAAADLEGAEGHGHSNTNVCVQDAQGFWLGPANTHTLIIAWRRAETSNVELEDQRGLTGSSLVSRRHTWIPAASDQEHTVRQEQRALLQQKTERCCLSTLTLPLDTCWSSSCTVRAAQISR